jgi:hypothetical protein
MSGSHHKAPGFAGGYLLVKRTNEDTRVSSKRPDVALVKIDAEFLLDDDLFRPGILAECVFGRDASRSAFLDGSADQGRLVGEGIGGSGIGIGRNRIGVTMAKVSLSDLKLSSMLEIAGIEIGEFDGPNRRTALP